jgi:hypothetical protein
MHPMTKVGDMIAAAIAFISDPLFAAVHISNTTKLLKNPRALCEAAEEKLGGVEQLAEDKVSGVALKKIHLCLTEFGLDQTKFSFVCSPDKGEFSCAGSNRDGTKATIHLPYRIISSLQDSAILSPSGKFGIAHEIGHFIKGQGHQGHVKQFRDNARARLVTYFIAMSTLFFYSPCVYYINHLISCIAAKAIGEMIDLHYAYRDELEADHWAAERSKEIAQGGIEYFEGYKQIITTVIINEEPQEEGLMTSLVSKVKKLYFWISVNTKIPNNFSHPPIQTRIAALKNVASFTS